MVGAVDTRWQTRLLRPRSFLSGFWLGFLGLFTEPLAGFRDSGVVGSIRGMASALLGVVLKPCVGLLVDAEHVVRSLAAKLNPAMDPEMKRRIQRARPPRFLREAQAPLLPYRAEENRGQELISRVRDGRHRCEGHMAHTELATGLTLLITGQRIILVHTKSNQNASSSFLTVEWEVVLEATATLEGLCPNASHLTHGLLIGCVN